MTSKLRMALPLIALVAALGLIACGGDDNGSDGDFVAQANELCNEFEERFNEFENAEPASPEEATELIGDFNTALEELNSELGELEPDTAEQEDFVERFDQLVGELAPLFERFQEAVENENLEEIQTLAPELAEIGTQFEDLEPLAEEAGLEGCGEEA